MIRVLSASRLKILAAGFAVMIVPAVPASASTAVPSRAAEVGMPASSGADSGLVGATYEPITPCRIVDTRRGGGRITDREIRDFAVVGAGPSFASQGGRDGGCELPTDAVAIEASVTAVSPQGSGFFRSWPAGESMPNATFMNFDRGMDITNTGALTLCSTSCNTGDIRARNFGGASHYVIDIQGFYRRPMASEGTLYVPLTPCRAVDTRQQVGTFTDREIRDLSLRGSGAAFAGQGGNAAGCDVPDNALAVEASVTAVSPQGSGFFRSWPAGESMPNATFMNFDRGMDITNTGALTLCSTSCDTGDIRTRNFGGASHYVIDIQGYFVPLDSVTIGDGSDDPGATYVPITPCRIVDTRAVGGPFANQETRGFEARGAGGVFADQGGRAGGCAIPSAAQGIEGSVTAVSPQGSGFFRSWPADESMPNATFMNFDRGMDITNTGALGLASSGLVDMAARNFGSASHYVIDIQGYYLPVNVIEDPLTTGYDSLFMGHSFFHPFARGMRFHAANAGFDDHTQQMVTAGGSGGAPEALWNDPAKRAQVQAVLDGGEVDLFGMTYHPDYPTLTGYQVWFDYALALNPDTRFFVGMPWLTSPGSLSADAYSTSWHNQHETTFHDLLDGLRAQYPGVEIYGIPYGQAAVELYERYDAGQLADVDSLVGNPDSALFTDDFGHPGDILVELGRLIWLRAIYGVHLTTYAYEPGYSTDLRALADAIMDEHDPAYNAS